MISLYLVVVGCSALLLMTLRAIWKRYKIFKVREEMGIGGPSVDLLSGNAIEMIRYQQRHGRAWNFNWVLEQQDKFGKIWGLYFGPNLRVLLADLDAIQEIWVKQFHNFVNRMPSPYNDGYPMRDGVLMARDDKWRAARNLVTKGFSSAKLKMLARIIHTKVDTFLGCVEMQAAGENGFDIHNDFQALALDVLCQFSFSMDTNSLTDRRNSFFATIRKYLAKLSLSDNFALMTAFILPEIDCIFNIIRPWTAFGKAERKLIETFKHACDYRWKCQTDFAVPDILSLMLDNESEETQKGVRFDRKTTLCNCLAVAITGFDTTSAAMSFTAWQLAKHPDAQAELQREIDRLPTTAGQAVTYEDLKQLRYLDAVFRESLRIMPPVAMLTTRECKRETQVLGMHVPKGVIFLPSIYTIHHDADLWPEPEHFKPERFLTDERRHPMAWMPFGAGPRNCIGLRFAEIELKLTIFHLLRAFTLRLGHNSEDPLQLTVTNGLLKPVNGVVLTVEKRQIDILP